MDIRLLDGVAGARAARGISVVIDVFRAASFAAYAAEQGARVVPVADLQDAYALKHRNPDWLIAGERHGRALPGFDFGNSPTEIAGTALLGRTIIHTTHAGTQGLSAASRAEQVLMGGLVTAAALVRYLRARPPAIVSLVRMGWQARESAAEDDLCAALIAARLTGAPDPCPDVRAALRDCPAAAKFFDPAATWAPEPDFALCTALDRFPFVLRLATAADGLRYLERVSA